MKMLRGCLRGASKWLDNTYKDVANCCLKESALDDIKEIRKKAENFNENITAGIKMSKLVAGTAGAAAARFGDGP